MASGLTLACSIRPLLVASLGIALVVLLYAITLSVIIAAALSRLSVVHNGAAEFTEQVYFALPFVFSRRRGSVPGAAVPRRQADFHFAFPQMCHSASSPSIQCAICMDAIRPGHLKRRLACQHEYHKSCIDRWVDKGAKRCPLCNTNVVIPRRSKLSGARPVGR